MNNINDKIEMFCNALLNSVESELSRKRGYGCVSYTSPGSHNDMDYRTFLNSANAIVEKLKVIKPFDYSNFSNLKKFGLEVEKAMFKATNGINTHKGLIFLLLFIYREWLVETPYHDIPSSIKIFSKDLKNDYINPINSAKLHNFGLNDIRTFPLSGYEFIFDFINLTKIDTNLCDEDKKTLYLLSHIDDTTTVKRSNIETLRFLQDKSKNTLKNYTESSADELNKYYIQNNISSGGVADVLTTANLILNLWR